MSPTITNKYHKKLRELQESSDHYDLFICSASFEDRCFALASSLPHSVFDTAIICKYCTSVDLSADNISKLNEILSPKCRQISFEKDSPLLIYDTLHEVIEEINPNSVLLDISTLTRETILIALMLFRQEVFSDIKLTLAYVPANRYSGGVNNNIADIWLSRGVNEIRTVLGYSGVFSSLKKTMLIILVGFEMERANILINSFEADKLYLGYVPSSESYSEELSLINNLNFNRLVNLASGCSVFEFSCKDIKYTNDVLKGIIEANIDKYNIVISPMNNKLSTLAVANVAFDYPEVQVCYASTNQYNTDTYSSSADEVFFFDFADIHIR